MARPLRLKKFLSIADALKLLPISRATFYRWLKDGRFGKLVSIDIQGKFYFIRKKDIPALKKLITKGE
ncbi:MAG: helix-turn-helix domain-containing protein [bacterium]